MSSDDDKKKNMSCANCGKTEEDGNTTLKACVACKMVKYCNRECQINHRPKHKKECKMRATELHEEALFKQPPHNEDCPICFIPLPKLHTTGSKYYACCGKVVCSGCIFAVKLSSKKRLCPFCRSPPAITDKDDNKREERRIELGDAIALNAQGSHYSEGKFGYPQSYTKALELWHRAAKLGNSPAHYNIGICYYLGNGVIQDRKKAKYHYEKSAIGGHVDARFNLGSLELNASRRIKHYLIAAGFGSDMAVEEIKRLYMSGHATKKDYEAALHGRQVYLDSIKSDQRDMAAKFDYDSYRYY